MVRQIHNDLGGDRGGHVGEWALHVLTQGSDEIERVDGETVAGSPLAPVLIELGFRQSPRALTLSA